ncbi:MAG: hypothetical protein HOO91_17460 [Bacteroidales bacterium]|nr:hypothetical protein [Bacteroidales bacterium]
MNPKVNKYVYIVVLLIGVSLLVVPTVCRSQTGTIKVSGGTVQLIASSLSHYNGGVILTNWSRIKINCTSGYIGRMWQLRIKSSDPLILSDDGNPDLPLSSLRLIPVNLIFNPLETSCIANGAYSLTNVGQVFMSGTGVLDNFDITFGITYELGTVTPLLDTKSGYYYTNLEYILEYF